MRREAGGGPTPPARSNTGITVTVSGRTGEARPRTPGHRPHGGSMIPLPLNGSSRQPLARAFDPGAADDPDAGEAGEWWCENARIPGNSARAPDHQTRTVGEAPMSEPHLMPLSPEERGFERLRGAGPGGQPSAAAARRENRPPGQEQSPAGLPALRTARSLEGRPGVRRV